MTNEQKQYIDKIAILVQQEIAQRGLTIPAGAVISQMVCETGWFKSSLWTRYRNAGGIKWSANCGYDYVELKTKEEYKQGVLTEIKAKFRKANSEAEGVKMYFDFLCGYSRYAKALQQTSAIRFFEELKAAGYATSSTYVQTLTTIYNTNSFVLYNVPVEQHKLSKEDIMKVQTLLNDLQLTDNEDKLLVVDGIFGKRSKQSFEKLQKLLY